MITFTIMSGNYSISLASTEKCSGTSAPKYDYLIVALKPLTTALKGLQFLKELSHVSATTRH